MHQAPGPCPFRNLLAEPEIAMTPSTSQAPGHPTSTPAHPRAVLKAVFTRWPGLTVFLCIAVVYVSTGTYGGNENRDTLSAAVAAWALGTHHTLNLAFLHPSKLAFPLWIVPGAHGMLVSNRFPGAVLLAAPLYSLVGGPYGPVPATLTAALSAASACALLYKVIARFQPARVALASTALFAFGTATWTVAGRELWEHSGSELLLAAGMLAILDRRWVASGLALGASVLFRPDLALVGVVLGVGLLWAERSWSTFVKFGAATVPGVAGLFAWNWVAYGRLTVSGGYAGVRLMGQGPVRLVQSITGNLVSPERGLLVCTPILLLAGAGLLPAWRRSSAVARLFAVAGLVCILSTLWFTPVTPHSDAFMTAGDDFIGNRYCLEGLLLAAPLLVEATVVSARRFGTAAAWVLSTLSIAFFSAGAFVQGETWGVNVDPWDHWAPLQVAYLYGAFPTVLGGAIGIAAVAVTWALLRAKGTAPARLSNLDLPSEAEPSGPSFEPQRAALKLAHVRRLRFAPLVARTEGGSATVDRRGLPC